MHFVEGFMNGFYGLSVYELKSISHKPDINSVNTEKDPIKP